MRSQGHSGSKDCRTQGQHRARNHGSSLSAARAFGDFASDNADVVNGNLLAIVQFEMALGHLQRPDFVAVIVVLEVSFDGALASNLFPQCLSHRAIKLHQHFHRQHGWDRPSLDQFVQRIRQVDPDATVQKEKQKRRERRSGRGQPVRAGSSKRMPAMLCAPAATVQLIEARGGRIRSHDRALLKKKKNKQRWWQQGIRCAWRFYGKPGDGRNQNM